MENIRRHDLKKEIKVVDGKICSFKVVCSDHFEKKFYKATSNKILLKGAIPTIVNCSIPPREAPSKRRKLNYKARHGQTSNMEADPSSDTPVTDVAPKSQRLLHQNIRD